MIDIKVPTIFPNVVAHLNSACSQADLQVTLEVIERILRGEIHTGTYLCNRLMGVGWGDEDGGSTRLFNMAIADALETTSAYEVSFGVSGWLVGQRADGFNLFSTLLANGVIVDFETSAPDVYFAAVHAHLDTQGIVDAFVARAQMGRSLANDQLKERVANAVIKYRRAWFTRLQSELTTLMEEKNT